MDHKGLYPSTALHGRLVHKIGRNIVAGAIGEGELLPRELDYSSETGMSRQAVREALKVLAAKGLINTRRRAGSVVTPNSHWNIFDQDVLSWHSPDAFVKSMAGPLIELRRIIEPEAAALAARRASDLDTAPIRSAFRRLERADIDDDGVEADVAFHVAVMAASGNVLLSRIGTLLAPALEVAIALQAKVRPSEEIRDAGHARILRAIEMRQADLAAAAMRAHLAESQKEVANLALRAGDDAVRHEELIADIHYPTTPLHGQCAHDLGRAIVRGTFKEGAFLPREAELAETRGVSRQAVREALRVLAAKGLVSTRQRSGTSVSSRDRWNLFDPDVIDWLGARDFPTPLIGDLMELREIVEPEAAYLAGERRYPGASALLAEALQQIKGADTASGERTRADARFHAGVLVASGNRFFARLGSAWIPLLEAMHKTHRPPFSGDREPSFAQHEAVVDAIRNSASDTARASVRALLRTLRARLEAQR